MKLIISILESNLSVRAWGRMELDSKGVGCSIPKDGGREAQARGGITRDSDRDRKAQAMVRTNRRDLRRFEVDVTVR